MEWLLAYNVCLILRFKIFRSLLCASWSTSLCAIFLLLSLSQQYSEVICYIKPLRLIVGGEDLFFISLILGHMSCPCIMIDFHFRGPSANFGCKLNLKFAPSPGGRISLPIPSLSCNRFSIKGINDGCSPTLQTVIFFFLM